MRTETKAGPDAEWSAFAARANELRERLHRKYGTVSDLTELIREARDER